MESKQVKAKLKELNDYFRDKIVAGDYETIKRGDHTHQILIDGKFNFGLWVANGPTHLHCYDSALNKPSVINIKFRVADQKKAFKIIEADRAATVDKEKIEKEKAEFDRLKAKYGE